MPKQFRKKREWLACFTTGYVPDTPWLIVLPINHILGRVPLMKAYLCGSQSPTIPRAVSHLKQSHFRHGHADRNGREGTGSTLPMPTCICGNLEAQYLCSNAEPIRNLREKLPSRNAQNVGLTLERRQSDDGR